MLHLWQVVLRLIFLFAGVAKKWRPRKSRLAPRLWLLWVIVVHSSLDIHKINKYKNNCRNLCLPFASAKSGGVNEPVCMAPLISPWCLRVKFAWRTHEVCKIKVLAFFFFSPVLSDLNPMFVVVVSEYCPSAYGGIMVMLDQRRLQMRRRVRGWVPGVVCQKRWRRSRVGRAAALR